MVTARGCVIENVKKLAWALRVNDLQARVNSLLVLPSPVIGTVHGDPPSSSETCTVPDAAVAETT